MEPLILSHASALSALRRARQQQTTISPADLTCLEQQRLLDSAVGAPRRIDFDELERFGVTAGQDEPLDVLVGRHCTHARTAAVRPHVLSRPPSGSLVRLRRDLYMVSPALLLIQLSERASWQEALALCEELCGSFTLENHGEGIASVEGFLTCEPVLSIGKLRHFLAYAKGISGLPTARLAAARALDGPASPMEAIVAAVFHAPMAAGGFAIKDIRLNYRIEFTREAVMASGMPYAVLDAYAAAAKSTLEYNGRYHDAGWSRKHDEKRTAALETMGIMTVPLNNDQLKSIDALEAIASMLYRRMGRQFRYRTQGYRPRQIALLNGMRETFGLRPC